MSLLTIGRISKLGFQSFLRNRLLSLAAVLVMTITLLTISLFAILNSVISTTNKELHNKIDLVVYFKDDASEERIQELKRLVSSQPETKSVYFVSKQEAESRYREKFKNDQVRLSSIDITGNVLPRSLEIKADPPEAMEKLVSLINSSDFSSLIRDKGISYLENKALIDKLMSVTGFIKIAGFATSAFFVLIAILVIFNTIKLTIFTRRDEIEIMRLVGATESFVRLPFIFEGILYGVFGTIVSTGLLYLILRAILNSSDKLGAIAASLASPFVVFLEKNLLLVLGLELLVGITIGALCALLAIGRDEKK